MKIEAYSVSDAFEQVIGLLDAEGSFSSPRGLAIKELINCNIVVKNPLDRIVRMPKRQMNFSYAVGELLWYISGRNDLETMEHYSTNMRRFSDDGITLNSAYGYRIFGHHEAIPFNQWEFAKKRLQDDPDSRQAIIHLHTPNNQPTKDEVCTLTLQFFIRDGKLDLVVTMRSNDIIKGFTYDAFAFTFLQEMMANELSVEIGTYYHNAGSMHIYEPDFYYLDDEIDYSIVEGLVMNRSYMKRSDFSDLLTFETHLREEVTSVREAALAWSSFTNEMTQGPEQELEIVFASALLLWKIYRLENTSSLKAVFADWVIGYVRQVNETYADILAAGCKLFGEHKIKIIIDGMDGTGKSTLAGFVARNADLVAKFGQFNLQHYDKPTDNFKFMPNYLQALKSSQNTVFDRFYFSEIAYQLALDRPNQLGAHESWLLNHICKNERVFVVLFVPTYTEIQKVMDRMDEKDRLLLQNVHEKLLDNYSYIASYLTSINANLLVVQEADYNVDEILEKINEWADEYVF